MDKGLAPVLACSYSELQQMRKMTFNLFPPGSLVAYFDQHNRCLYILVTKRQYFQKPTYETLELTLQAIKQHLQRHNFQELVIPKLGYGYDHLHWPTVFSILLFFRVHTSKQQYLSLHDSPAYPPVHQLATPYAQLSVKSLLKFSF